MSRFFACCSRKKKEEFMDPLEPARMVCSLVEKVIITVLSATMVAGAAALIFLAYQTIQDKDFKSMDSLLNMAMSTGGVPLTITQFMYILMILFAVAILSALIGLCGTWRDGKMSILVYCLCIFLLIALMLTASIMCYIFLAPFSFGGLVVKNIETMCNPAQIGSTKAELCAPRRLMDEPLEWTAGEATDALVSDAALRRGSFLEQAAAAPAAALEDRRRAAETEGNFIGTVCGFLGNAPSFCKDQCKFLTDTCGGKPATGTTTTGAAPTTTTTTVKGAFHLPDDASFMIGKSKVEKVMAAVWSLSGTMLLLMCCVCTRFWEIARTTSVVDKFDCCNLSKRYIKFREDRAKAAE